MLEETGVLEPLGNLSGLTQTVNGEARARSGTCLPPDMPYCLLPQSQHLFFFFFFRLCRSDCGILVPRPGIKFRPLAVTVWSSNHWIAREFPQPQHLKADFFLLLTTDIRFLFEQYQ